MDIRTPYIRTPYIGTPSIKAQSVGGMVTGKKTPPTPITYLTQWKIVGNSEVKTLPYPDGVVLPTGYKRCEYLTFDGSSYINTGVKTANDIGYDVKCRTVDGKTLIGARTTASSNGFVIGFFQNNKKLAVSYGGITSTTVVTTHDYVDDSVHHIILDSVKFQIDDEVIDISSLRTTANVFYDIYLGTWNNSNSPDSRFWTSDIYDTIIYNSQGELWHGIPCLDANDVPCFYDLVSQTAFYNQGSGSFTYKLYPQPTEIWSCGEYSAVDGKYHILVQPLGGSIADIALTEPLRMVDDVADTIEFPSNTEGKALVTRPFGSVDMGDCEWVSMKNNDQTTYRYRTASVTDMDCPSSVTKGVLLSAKYQTRDIGSLAIPTEGIGCYLASGEPRIYCYDSIMGTVNDSTAFREYVKGVEIIYKLATPTTELVDAPQIEEAESYSCVISQGGKAVEWSSFTTE